MGNKKNSQLIHYKRLSDFFEEHYPEIEISSETEKELIIKNLFEAYSFDNAKSIARKLLGYNDFSVKQLNDITKAFSENNQIYWIKNDYGIYDVRKKIIEENIEIIDKSIYKLYKYTMENH